MGRPDNFSVSVWIPGYIVLVLLMVPVKASAIGLVGAPGTLWIMVVVGGFLGSLMWRYHSDGGFCNTIDAMYGYRLYYSIIVLHLKLYCVLTYDIDHVPASFEEIVTDWYECSNKVADIIGHTCGCVVVKSIDKGFRV